MKLSELRGLDPKNIGQWPFPLRALIVLILCVGVVAAGFWFDTRLQIEDLEKHTRKERELKDIFETKQRKFANLEPLKLQLAEMEQSFGDMLRLLPDEAEIEGLLVDISQSGLAAGLEFELFKPEKEIPAEFYAIKPINLTVTGSYHEFGEFISALASLPRIVTQHDITISPRGGKENVGLLVMNATAKTYRYLTEEEIQRLSEGKNAKKGKRGKKKKKKKKKKRKA